MNQTIGIDQPGFDVRSCDRSTPSETCVQSGHESTRTIRICVKDGKPLDTYSQRRMRNCRTGTTRAELQYAMQCGVRKAVTETLCKS